MSYQHSISEREKRMEKVINDIRKEIKGTVIKIIELRKYMEKQEIAGIVDRVHKRHRKYIERREVERKVKEILDGENVVNDVNKVVNAIHEIQRARFFKEIDIEKVDTWGETLGRLLSKTVDLKTSQIRRIFGEFKKLHNDVKRGQFERGRVLLMKPKLAYVAGRHEEAKPLVEVLSEGVKKVINAEDYNRIFQFFEAILAYHKYYGGKD